MSCLTMVHKDSLVVFSVELSDESHGLRSDVLQGRDRTTYTAQVRLHRQIQLVEIHILVLLLWAGEDQMGSNTLPLP